MVINGGHVRYNIQIKSRFIIYMNVALHRCMFFQQGGDQCVCMHAVSPADIIPTYDFPVLYILMDLKIIETVKKSG